LFALASEPNRALRAAEDFVGTGELADELDSEGPGPFPIWDNLLLPLDTAIEDALAVESRRELVGISLEVGTSATMDPPLTIYGRINGGKR